MRWPRWRRRYGDGVVDDASDGQRAASWPSRRSCDETAVAVVEGGRRIVANVVASQVALHGATGGIVPEVAARAHLRWMIPVLEEARSEAGIDDWSELDAVAVTEGPGLAGSLLVGHHDGQDAGVGARLPLVPVNHLEGHIYAAWLLDPGRGGEAGARVPARGARRQRRPHVPRRDARPPDGTGCSARRSTMPRARRSTRWGGCSACPTRAGRPSWAAAGRQRTTGVPARLAGRDVRLLVQRPQDGRAAGGRGELGLAGRPRGLRRPGAARDATSPSWHGLPGVGRRRAGDEDAARGRGDRRADDRLGGGVAANRVLRERIADGAAARGIRSSCRGPGCARTTPR